jgi:hypothetical protein
LPIPPGNPLVLWKLSRTSNQWVIFYSESFQNPWRQGSFVLQSSFVFENILKSRTRGHIKIKEPPNTNKRIRFLNIINIPSIDKIQNPWVQN